MNTPSPASTPKVVALRKTQWREFEDDEVADWKRVRTALEHENLLVSHRFNWLLTSQGFLFASYFLILKDYANVSLAAREYYQGTLVMLGISGLVVCVHLRAGIRAADMAHKALETWWRERPKRDENRHPPICGHPPKVLMKFPVPYSSFPFVIMLAWIASLLVPLNPYIAQYILSKWYVYAIVAAVSAVFFLGTFLGQHLASKAQKQDESKKISAKIS